MLLKDLLYNYFDIQSYPKPSFIKKLVEMNIITKEKG